MAEETNGNMTVYLYDINGSPVGMQYHAATAGEYDWQVFWYEKNLQGDIVAVYSDSGTKLISYTYDAWGNFTLTYHNGGASTKAIDNPFTYRGYYYEKDLNLYYLCTRYYDSKICRFINADSALYHSMIGYNLFAYCNNNPINYYDPYGEAGLENVLQWGLAIAAADGALPFGDILAIGIGLVVGVCLLAEAITEVTDSVSSAEKNDNVKDAPKNVKNPEDKDKTENDYDENNSNKLPMKGEPNSDKHLYDKRGLKQTRHYGPDGRAEYDIDYHHPNSGNNHKFPHKHFWKWNGANPERRGGIDIF